MKATGRSEEEILSWPIEHFNTYVECLNDDEESQIRMFKNLFRT
jgi:hypothetical protein